MRHKLRVVALLGPGQAHLFTLAKLIEAGVRVEGAVICNQHVSGIDLRFVRKMISKQGLSKLSFQAIERVVYKVLNYRFDRRVYAEMFDKNYIAAVLSTWHGQLINTSSYEDSRVLEFVLVCKPDVLVIHTPYWISKRVRALAGNNLIGAHPGITQFYRGVHSPFWAIYNGDQENIGFTIFWVDSGVDSGDIIYQERIVPKSGDSYMSISWRGMAEAAKNMANILANASSLQEIQRKTNSNLANSNVYYHPTLFQYLKYRLKSTFR
jgi:methionyl-tRNA formyltransferase